MAFISAEDIAVIRKDLKAAFPFVKFSITGHNYTSVNVSVIAAPFNFYSNKSKDAPANRDLNQYSLGEDDEQRATAQAGLPHPSFAGDFINQSYGDHEAYLFLRAVKDVITKKWWDESDSQVDYFHTAFYYHIEIGKWDKPFTKTEWPAGVEHLKDPVKAEAQATA